MARAFTTLRRQGCRAAIACRPITRIRQRWTTASPLIALLRVRTPREIIVSGGSAGGNLAAALTLRARDEGLPMPAGLILNTPEVDLTESGDSFRTNLGVDPSLRSLMPLNLLYANGHDSRDPYLSPLFGDLNGFPPTILTTGTRDLYLSNTVRMHRKLRAAGVQAEIACHRGGRTHWLSRLARRRRDRPGGSPLYRNGAWASLKRRGAVTTALAPKPARPRARWQGLGSWDPRSPLARRHDRRRRRNAR
jgi:acetyl esterase/lipase